MTAVEISAALLLVLVIIIAYKFYARGREGFSWSITPKYLPPIPAAGAAYLKAGGNNHVIVIYNRDSASNCGSRHPNAACNARFKYDNIKNKKFAKPIMIIYVDESHSSKPKVANFPAAFKYWNGGAAQYNTNNFSEDNFYHWVET